MFKRQLMVGAAIALLGGASFAGDNGMLRGEAWDGSFDPTARPGVYGRSFEEPRLSRAEVIAELERVRSAGEISTGEAWDGSIQPSSRSGAFGRPFSASLSREEVKAELQRARASGELDRMRADYVGGD